ncbi:hypothetical protein [Allorhizocola rhizosphaerae]|uniref:hypothetical protein n=1 Tax=Allorhizocola rhizosphaerae TaxID=1872709 RepID=UPI000E3D22B1|nr:hypothetical protein [Allorhizocola rhizosphaerae]
MTPPVACRELRQLTGLIVNQVSHWTPARWGNRGDALYEVIQRIAGPSRAVPRLGPAALADQLRVVVDDLIETGDDDAVTKAVADLAALRGRLTAAQ